MTNGNGDSPNYAASSPRIGKIERVPLRSVWAHEAYDLTTWLEDKIDVLNDVLDVNLSNAEREHAAGSFSVDLVAEDDSGGIAVIENQLERSNHDHLGKLITYTAFTDARVAVWIVSDPRPEHVRAISWLNEAAPAQFYLLKIEGIRIGDSPPCAAVDADRWTERGEPRGGRGEEGSRRAIPDSPSVLD